MRHFLIGLALVLAAGLAGPGYAQTKEKRVAFVVGNSNYAAGALPTAANDAGLVAQTLQAAGFDVVGARDLDAETFRQSYGDFLRRLSSGGPDTVAFVYVAGYALQYGNENYLVPIGAVVARDGDIPIEAIRFNDLITPLSGLNLKARFTVFDAAFPSPFAKGSAPLAGGLALVDAAPGSLVAYNAAPGTVAPVGKGNYGPYAQTLAAIMREGGLAPDDLFDRVRLRVNEVTKGAEVPWDTSRIDASFRFFERAADAPSPAGSSDRLADLRTKPIGSFPAPEAYTAALDRDTTAGYEEYLTSYGRDPNAKRVRALLAARREALTWNRTTGIDTPAAYWSYLRRYPKGPHAGSARFRLQAFSAAYDPPPSFLEIVYDVPPPPPEEFVYIDRPVVYFDDPDYGFAPPPPPPLYYVPAIPAAFLDLGPPPEPDGLFYLPSPAFVPLPVYVNPPVSIEAPQNNVFFVGGGSNGGGSLPGIHQPLAAPAAQGGNGLRNAVIGAGIAAAVVLPAAAALRGTSLRREGITTPADLNRARADGRLGRLPRPDAGPRGAPLPGQPLPGANGRPLPPGFGRPPGAPPIAPAAVLPQNARVVPGGPPAPNRSPAQARPLPGQPSTATGPASRARAAGARQQEKGARPNERQPNRQERQQRQERGERRPPGAPLSPGNPASPSPRLAPARPQRPAVQRAPSQDPRAAAPVQRAAPPPPRPAAPPRAAPPRPAGPPPAAFQRAAPPPAAPQQGRPRRPGEP